MYSNRIRTELEPPPTHSPTHPPTLPPRMPQTQKALKDTAKAGRFRGAVMCRRIGLRHFVFGGRSLKAKKTLLATFTALLVQIAARLVPAKVTSDSEEDG